jgi:methylglyoxal synthase
MMHSTVAVAMMARKRIALIAHNNRKRELLEWARDNLPALAHHELYATATTGRMLQSELGVSVTCFLSGPLGGDQQVGAAIVEGRIDVVIFFWDPLEAQPHDADVKALLRVAVVHDVPVACNLATAAFLLSSPLMLGDIPRRRLGDKARVTTTSPLRHGLPPRRVVAQLAAAKTTPVVAAHR